MALGMSREEYWNGDIFAPLDYIEADRERQRRFNQEAWLQGMYMHEAFSVALVRAFSKDRGNLPDYSKEPYDIFNDHEAERKEREAQYAESYMKRFVEWGKQINGEK